jgi:hypothetical protein
MATADFTTTAPRIERVPAIERLHRNEHGEPFFIVVNPFGPMVITGCARHGNRYWEAYGSPEALLDAGLIRTEWLPGQHGNNATTQRVVFSNGEAVIQHGKPGSGVGQRVQITRHGQAFRVLIPATTEQAERIKTFMDEAQKGVDLLNAFEAKIRAAERARLHNTPAPTSANVLLFRRKGAT